MSWIIWIVSALRLFLWQPAPTCAQVLTPESLVATLREVDRLYIPRRSAIVVKPGEMTLAEHLREDAERLSAKDALDQRVAVILACADQR